VRVLDLVRVSWRPFLAGMTMLLLLSTLAFTDAALLALGMKVMVGAVAYTLTLFLLWWMSGRPGGIEKAVAEKLLQLARGSARAE
jgi:hypothetical protein